MSYFGRRAIGKNGFLQVVIISIDDINFLKFIKNVIKPMHELNDINVLFSLGLVKIRNSAEYGSVSFYDFRVFVNHRVINLLDFCSKSCFAIVNHFLNERELKIQFLQIQIFLFPKIFSQFFILCL